jgi:hypothetical protein
MPRTGPLFVDTISVTLPVQQRPRRVYIQNALHFPPLEYEYRITRAYQRGFYAGAYWVEDEGDFKIHVQYEPYRNAEVLIEEPPVQDDRGQLNHNWLRLEWNAQKVRPEELRRFLLYLFDGDEQSLIDEVRHGRATRIDFAVMLAWTNLEKLLITQTRMKSTIYYGRDGKMETIYLGAPDSDRRIVIYDKIRERVDACAIPFQDARVRIEARINEGIYLPRLREIANPFSDLIVREYRALEETGAEHTWAWFLDSCRTRGATAALALIQQNRTRQNWRRRIREVAQPSWWNADRIWESGRDAAIQNIGLPYISDPLWLDDELPEWDEDESDD